MATDGKQNQTFGNYTVLRKIYRRKGDDRMDFKLKEEHEMIRHSVRAFAEGVLAPKVAEPDEQEN